MVVQLSLPGFSMPDITWVTCPFCGRLFPVYAESLLSVAGSSIQKHHSTGFLDDVYTGLDISKWLGEVSGGSADVEKS